MRFPTEPPLHFSCRVLRARRFVVDDALALVAKTAAWRREIDIDALVRRTPAEILGGAEEDELSPFYSKT
jgi:hypothetical protein